MKGDFL